MNKLEHLRLETIEKDQINEVLYLLDTTLGSSVLGVYLYGSAVTGGLMAHSDLDILAVTNRAT